MSRGYSRTRLYQVWDGMKTRCYNANDPGYKNYGGRGITVCDEWKTDFLAFRDWALSTGYDETAPRGQYTIERKDNNGPYSPENCRWATIKEQANNKRTTKRIDTDHGTLSLKQWCDEQGLNYANELKRVQRREDGRQTMEEYNRKRSQRTNEQKEMLRRLMAENPTWSNVRLSKEMGVSEARIRRLKKTM